MYPENFEKIMVDDDTIEKVKVLVHTWTQFRDSVLSPKLFFILFISKSRLSRRENESLI